MHTHSLKQGSEKDRKRSLMILPLQNPCASLPITPTREARSYGHLPVAVLSHEAGRGGPGKGVRETVFPPLCTHL